MFVHVMPDGGEVVAAGNKVYTFDKDGRKTGEETVGALGTLMTGLKWAIGGLVVVVIGRTVYVHYTGRAPPGERAARKAARASARAAKKAARKTRDIGKAGAEKIKSGVKFIKDA